jgi:hypothetical protein
MNKRIGTIAALVAAAAVLAPAHAAIAGDPDERPRKLAYDQATLPPGNSLQDTFTPGGAIVQMYYRCGPGVTGNLVLSAGGGSPPAASRTLRCDDQVHWVRNIPVRIGREYTVRLKVANPGFAGYSVWGLG